jgi:hypothetical protein
LDPYAATPTRGNPSAEAALLHLLPLLYLLPLPHAPKDFHEYRRCVASVALLPPPPSRCS